MAQPDPFNDLPDPPPGGDSFPDHSASSGGYLAGSDDQEIRKIRRRVSPVGKAVFVVVLAVGGGVGYFLAKSAIEDSEIQKLTTRGREELRQITSQSLPPEELASRIRGVYQNNRSPSTRSSARRLLAGLRDPQSVPMMIDGVRSGDVNERRQAALGLAEIGQPGALPARDAIIEVLPRANPLVDQPALAWAAVVLNDTRAWDTVVTLLGTGQLQSVQSLDEPPRRIFDAALVARMAGRDRLQRLVSSETVALRRFAAVSLAELATPEVFDSLVTLSRDRDVDVAREAAVGLGRTGDPRAGDPIVGFLNAHADQRDTVLTALTQNSGATGLSVVLSGSRDAQTRAEAARLLHDLHDPGSADAFLQVLQTTDANATDETVRNTRRHAIMGLAEIGDPRAAAGLMELALRPLTPGIAVDPNMDQAARLALDELRRIPGAPTAAKAQLLTMLNNERSEFMRTQVLIALGAAEDPSIGPQLMTQMNNEQFQEGAAIAVCRLRYAPGIARVRADMRRPPRLRMVDPTVADEPVFIKRRNAIRAIAWTRDATIAPDLIRIVEDPLDRDQLREEAGHALAAIADDQGLDDIASRAIEATRDPNQRRYFLYALRGRSTPAISNRLVAAYLVPGAPEGLQRAAAIAAGFGGDDSTAALLRPLISSTDANVRINASVAAILCGDRDTANALMDRLAAEPDLQNLLSQIFVTRSATGNNQGMQLEPFDLMPITESMFTDGRIYRRVNMATMLERGRGGTNHYDFAIQWLRLRVKNGWENSIGIGPYQIRTRLREAATGTDPFRSDMAFKMLRSLNDRGALLALRRGRGDSAERARRELVEMQTTAN